MRAGQVALGLEHLYMVRHAEDAELAWPLAGGFSALPLQARVYLAAG